MGKKKIATQTTEEVLKDEKKLEEKELTVVSGSTKKHTDSGKIYIAASFNNTIITVTDKKGNVITWGTAGSMGFSGPKKATPFAASKIVGVISEKLQKIGLNDIEIVVKGVGGGRDSAVRSFINRGFNVFSIKDVTPIPHNGVKPPKVRRV